MPDDTGNFNVGDHVMVEGIIHRVSIDPPVLGERLYLVPIQRMCEGCGKNPGGDYAPGKHVLCAPCVEKALAFFVAQDVFDDIREHDEDLGRVITILREDDSAMRQRAMPYVDSTSAGWDMMRGKSYADAWELMTGICAVIVNATREPGDVPNP